MTATIVRLRAYGMQWLWDGAVMDPKRGVLVLTKWFKEGEHLASHELDIIHEVTDGQSPHQV
jgi:hypothetical protein